MRPVTGINLEGPIEDKLDQLRQRHSMSRLGSSGLHLAAWRACSVYQSSAMSPLTDLAREILRNAEIIDGATSQSKNTNSLDVDEARTALLDATHKLTLQAQTPEAYLFQQMWSVRSHSCFIPLLPWQY
jgi:hypothetical protein